jgi:type IV secretory pathway protease TraF
MRKRNIAAIFFAGVSLAIPSADVVAAPGRTRAASSQSTPVGFFEPSQGFIVVPLILRVEKELLHVPLFVKLALFLMKGAKYGKHI